MSGYAKKQLCPNNHGITGPTPAYTVFRAYATLPAEPREEFAEAVTGIWGKIDAKIKAIEREAMEEVRSRTRECLL